jgi:hypothetical protein
VRKQSALPVCLFCLFCVGCLHHSIQTTSKYSLEKTSEYAVLVPSIAPIKTDEDFQTIRIALPGTNKSPALIPNQCSIPNPIFSLSPDNPSNPNGWLFRSPNVQGWEKHGGEIDITAEWSNFTSALRLRKELGCFSKEDTLSSITKSIIEQIPLPANESLLFFYSFNGSSGFADLSSGMQVKIEQISIESRNNQNTGGKPTSIETQYEVVSSATSGVALQLSKPSSRRPNNSSEPNESFIDLPSRFQTAQLLRLFLERSKDGKTKQPALIGARNMSDIETATRQIEESSIGDCPALPSKIVCVPFGKDTGVSLLFPVWLNGKLSYRPIGTTLGYMIDILSAKEKTRALETMELKRPLATGGYADVIFKKSFEDAQQIFLLNGDRLTWKH